MAEQTTAPAPDLTPTERAIATMRAQQAAAPYPLTGNEWLLYAEVERLQGVVARQAAAIHDWELGHLDADTALRQVRDAMGQVTA